MDSSACIYLQRHVGKMGFIQRGGGNLVRGRAKFGAGNHAPLAGCDYPLPKFSLAVWDTRTSKQASYMNA